MSLTSERQLELDTEFAATVYRLLPTKNVGTQLERCAIAEAMLADYAEQTDKRPAENLLERLADYILGNDPTVLTESQLKRRQSREHSRTELSS